MPQTLTCRQLTRLIEGYVSDTLDDLQRARFEAHLADCPACVRYLAGYTATVRAARRLREPLPVVPTSLIEAILAARVTPAPERHPIR